MLPHTEEQGAQQLHLEVMARIRGVINRANNILLAKTSMHPAIHKNVFSITPVPFQFPSYLLPRIFSENRGYVFCRVHIEILKFVKYLWRTSGECSDCFFSFPCSALEKESMYIEANGKVSYRILYRVVYIQYFTVTLFWRQTLCADCIYENTFQWISLMWCGDVRKQDHPIISPTYYS